MDWAPCSNEFEKIISRLTVPRVVIENGACLNSTVVKVDSARKDGILLEAVQVLTDLNLSIKKAYISSDGRWLMDVFHVTDLNGNKVADKSVLGYIEKSLGTINDTRVFGVEGLTAFELTGTDRVGLMSEVFAVLSELMCNVVDARVWTHNGRIASIIQLKDCNSGCQIKDSQRISTIVARLRPVLKGDNDTSGVKINVWKGATHTERRLHQMMFANGNHNREKTSMGEIKSDLSVVTINNLKTWGYSVVNVQCKDRLKLLFDVVCTLTDMEYAVFHATVHTERNQAYMEFYIRRKDGTPISFEPEKQSVLDCLRAAIERRTYQGVRLELCTQDRPCLLADVTRTFRENGLNITRADISTRGNVASNTFYVTDSNGLLPDSKTIDNVRERIGLGKLKVQEVPSTCQHEAGKEDGVGLGGTMLISLGSIVMKNLYNLGLIRWRWMWWALCQLLKAYALLMDWGFSNLQH
ncbi:hypothetical protein V2J09_022409 [Rumex salicifolius]